MSEARYHSIGLMRWSPGGIWATTKNNKVKQNIPKRPCTAHQHAQILYWTHFNENIDAKERKYTNGHYADTYKQENRTPTKHPGTTKSGNQSTWRAPRRRWWSKPADFTELYRGVSGVLSHIFLDVHLQNISNNTIRQRTGQTSLSVSHEIGSIFDFFIFDTNFGRRLRQGRASNVQVKTFTR